VVDTSVAAAFNRSLRDAISRSGLAPVALSLYEGLTRANPVSAVSNLRFQLAGAPDDLPIPPAHLRFLVAGTADIGWFLRGGELGRQTISEVVERSDIVIGERKAILDFGCGCGRVTRYWGSGAKARVCGTDYNQELIDWCRRNLPFAEFSVNHLTPPLSYNDGEFDLIYAFSVFTHLTEDLQIAWMRELTRILRRGGHLLISTHGERYAHRLNDRERQVFGAGGLVVKNNVRAPGSNTCAAYHPLAYVRGELARGLELVEHVPEGARGNPHQDLYVLRKPDLAR
jgi:SAM-dependent methyltransferase